MTLTEGTAKELILAQEAFEQGYYTIGKLHLNNALFNVQEYNYLTGFIGPPYPPDVMPF